MFKRSVVLATCVAAVIALAGCGDTPGTESDAGDNGAAKCHVILGC